MKIIFTPPIRRASIATGCKLAAFDALRTLGAIGARCAFRIPLVSDIALAALRFENIEEVGGVEKSGKILHATVARVDWRLSPGSAACGGHRSPPIITSSSFYRTA